MSESGHHKKGEGSSRWGVVRCASRCRVMGWIRIAAGSTSAERNVWHALLASAEMCCGGSEVSFLPAPVLPLSQRAKVGSLSEGRAASRRETSVVLRVVVRGDGFCQGLSSLWSCSSDFYIGDDLADRVSSSWLIWK